MRRYYCFSKRFKTFESNSDRSSRLRGSWRRKQRSETFHILPFSRSILIIHSRFAKHCVRTNKQILNGGKKKMVITEIHTDDATGIARYRNNVFGRRYVISLSGKTCNARIIYGLIRTGVNNQTVVGERMRSRGRRSTLVTTCRM